MTTRVQIAAAKAIAAGGGSKANAQRVLVELALQDDQLLKELVAPVLQALAMQAIEKATISTRPSAPLPPLKAPRASPTSVRAGQAPGYNPLAAATTANQAGPRPAASSRHVEALKLLASAYHKEWVR